MSLQEIQNKIIEYGEQRGEKWNFDKTGYKCLDDFSLNYMVAVVDYFINKDKECQTKKD